MNFVHPRLKESFLQHAKHYGFNPYVVPLPPHCPKLDSRNDPFLLDIPGFWDEIFTIRAEDRNIASAAFLLAFRKHAPRQYAEYTLFVGYYKAWQEKARAFRAQIPSTANILVCFELCEDWRERVASIPRKFREVKPLLASDGAGQKEKPCIEDEDGSWVLVDMQASTNFFITGECNPTPFIDTHSNVFQVFGDVTEWLTRPSWSKPPLSLMDVHDAVTKELAAKYPQPLTDQQKAQFQKEYEAAFHLPGQRLRRAEMCVGLSGHPLRNDLHTLEQYAVLRGKGEKKKKRAAEDSSERVDEKRAKQEVPVEPEKQEQQQEQQPQPQQEQKKKRERGEKKEKGEKGERGEGTKRARA